MYSPTCTCILKKSDVYGCIDSNASNYNLNATINDGTCIYLSHKNKVDEEEIINTLLIVGLAVGGYQTIKKSKKK